MYDYRSLFTDFVHPSSTVFLHSLYSHFITTKIIVANVMMIIKFCSVKYAYVTNPGQCSLLCTQSSHGNENRCKLKRSCSDDAEITIESVTSEEEPLQGPPKN